jgi:glycosyltransferase involved in cell wall biosynthesis
MRLNWFSPLPPARTGIAEWVGHVLPALCARAEVVLWTDQDEWELLPDVPAVVRRYRATSVPWAELHKADVSVYHIGNNDRFHGGIWQVSRRHPGLVVLHDLCLPHLFVPLFRQLNDPAGYCAAMEHFYGDVGRWLAGMLWDQRVPTEYMADRCPHVELAVEGALGVLVHVPDGFTALKPMRRWPLAYQPLAYRPGRWNAAPPKGDKPYRLILFGYIGSNRCLGAVLEALAHFRDAAPFHLHVYGRLWNESYVRARVKALDLRRCVTLHGAVSDAQLDAALAASHLAINLRNPTMGEASLSQLRIWDHALPSLVSATGWYATLPPTTVTHVMPHHEGEDLVRHLEGFLHDPAAFARRGINGRRWLEEYHAPRRYVEGLLRLCDEARCYRPQAARYYLAARAAEEMSAWTADPADAIGERVAGHIVSLAAEPAVEPAADGKRAA